MQLSRFIILFWLMGIAACSSTPPAPVIDRLPANKSTTIQKNATDNRPTYKAGDWRPDTYTVKKGDNLYSIGLEHGYDYKDIAQANHITAPYTIHVGQVLSFKTLIDKVAIAETKPATSSQAASQASDSDDVEITPINIDADSAPAITASANTTPVIIAIAEPKAIREPYSEDALKRPLPVAKPVIATVTDTTSKPGADTKPEVKPDTKTEAKAETKPEPKPAPASPEDIDWAWPTKGKVVANFNESSNKGIDIAGTTGQAVNASAAGKVIYSGSDLRGYGKLVIVKHNAVYLSVYAHNSQILVKEGQQVSRGQKIAEMGNTDSNTVKLHFEIRRQGKSVDPSKYLAAN